MNFEQWMSKAQELRNAALLAETDLMLFLMKFEESGPWKDVGFNTFATVIRQYKLTRPERYAEFKVSAGKIDVDDLRIIGVGAATQAVKINDRKTLHEYIKAAKLRVEEDGFPWSDEQAERARMRVSPDLPKPLRATERENRMAKLLAEKDALIESLRAELAEKEAEIETLQKQLAKKKN